ncbi:hypothetical protein JAAARDRAFT_187494 [Jaapia argillacea MUCL 33604]|uniref:F-box domain-containing protein n=1 Tax=Jaapia argillacea MUCL 33604 TaxID=933084 RepID=A0A067QNB0_9AGAM|nr:hypothetical protein JAAARDRAFT_187494 [Jaapia argillacea MUCL 33604]
MSSANSENTPTRGATSVGFISLPIELIVDILILLEIKTLLKCRQVCRFLSDAIDEAVGLQYKIELAASGMEDGPPNDAESIDSRLDKLRDHVNAWDEMTLSKQLLPGPIQSRIYRLCGGVFGYVPIDRPSQVAFTQLPSKSRNIPQKQWTINLTGRTINAFTMDPSQDLLLIVAGRHRANSVTRVDESCIEIHTLSLSTGQKHRLAGAELLSQRDGSLHERWALFEPRICGKHVGVLLCSRRMEIEGETGPADEIVLWNWKTSDVIRHFLGYNIQNFVLVNEENILVPSNTSTIRLEFFSLAKPCPYPISIQNAPFDCVFHLPEMQPSATIDCFTVDISHPRTWTKHSTFHVPFFRNNDNGLVAISVMSDVDASVEHLVFFFSLSTLLRRISTLEAPELMHEFSWDGWGHETRIVHAPPSHTAFCSSVVCGTKFLAVSDDNTGTVEVQVFEFNMALHEYLHGPRTHKGEGSWIPKFDSWAENQPILTFKDVSPSDMPPRKNVVYFQSESESEVFYHEPLLTDDTIVLPHEVNYQHTLYIGTLHV